MNDFQMYEEGRKEAEVKKCKTAIVRGSYYWVKFNKETDQIPNGCLWVFGINGIEYIEEGSLNNKNYFTHYIKVKKPYRQSNFIFAIRCCSFTLVLHTTKI